MSNRPKQIMDGTTDGWARLIQAILDQAWADYIAARGELIKARKFARYEKAFREALAIELFYSSGWFIELTGRDGRIEFEKIEKEFGHLLSDTKEVKF